MSAHSTVRFTGLSNCCLQTIVNDTTEDYELKTLTCNYCNDVLIFDNVAWEQLIQPYYPKSAVRRK